LNPVAARQYCWSGGSSGTFRYKDTQSYRASTLPLLQTSLPSALRDNEAFFAVRTQLNGNWRCRLN
jgi:hypothetical protein